MPTIQELPTEILEIILRQLKGTELAGCRRVCRRWRSLVDALPDAAWARCCRQQFPAADLAQQHSNLPYRDLYRSLSLWDKLEQAEVQHRHLSMPHPSSVAVNGDRGIKILRNRILAVVTLEIEDAPVLAFWGNSINYYDAVTLELIRSQRYSFQFTKYDESDDIITLVDRRYRLHIIIKKNNKVKICPLCEREGDDDIEDIEYEAFTSYFLFSSIVYFLRRPNRILCVAKIKVIDGEENVDIQELITITEPIIDFAVSGENFVNILTGNIYLHREDRILNVYCCEDTVLKLRKQIRAPELKEYGFQWTDYHHPFAYSISASPWPRFHPSVKKVSTIRSHSHIVLIGTYQNFVHIFKNTMYGAKPSRTIKDLRNETRPEDLVDMFIDDEIGIRELGVIEILNGHRIIVLCENAIHIFDFVHNERKRTRKRTAAATYEPGTSGIKKRRSRT